MSDTFYSALVDETHHDGEQTYLKTMWVDAAHIGEAIHFVTQAARQDGFTRPLVAEIDPYDKNELKQIQQLYRVEINDRNIFTTTSRFYYPAEPVVTLPKGVIVSCYDDSDGNFKEGFAKEQDGEFYYLNVVLDDARLLETFISLIETLTQIKVSWVEVDAEFDQASKVQLLTNEHLNNSKNIHHFLTNTSTEVLQNGFLKFTVYDDIGQTNLQIDDHKQICLITRSSQVRGNIEKKLIGLNIAHDDNLRQIKKQVHHWHYRPYGSMNRSSLIDFLLSNEFELWQEHEVDA